MRELSFIEQLRDVLSVAPKCQFYSIYYVFLLAEERRKRGMYRYVCLHA